MTGAPLAACASTKKVCPRKWKLPGIGALVVTPTGTVTGCETAPGGKERVVVVPVVAVIVPPLSGWITVETGDGTGVGVPVNIGVAVGVAVTAPVGVPVGVAVPVTIPVGVPMGVGVGVVVVPDGAVTVMQLVRVSVLVPLAPLTVRATV